MKRRYFSLFANGFIGSFQLASGLILAIVSTMTAFASHATEGTKSQPQPTTQGRPDSR